jgi:hypothetical protein
MIELIGQKGTPEHDAAIAIRDAFVKTWPGIESTPKEEDYVKIASCVKLSGQKVSDIDVVLVGKLRPNRFIVPSGGAKDADGNSLVSSRVRVKSFVAAIEVKDHPAENMVVEAGGVRVKYHDGWKSATEQNEQQRYALLSYLRDATGLNPWVHRCLLLHGIHELPKDRGIPRPTSGAVPALFDATSLLVAMASVNGIKKLASGYTISCGDEALLEGILSDSLLTPLVPSSLDRKRMDRIAARPEEARQLAALLGQSRIHLRGNGGTGKTVLLLQSAYEAFQEHGKRSLVLTYNTALSADIQRTLALMGIPGDGEAGGISVRTVMSFTYGWLNKLGVVQANDQVGFEGYEAKCSEALQYIAEGAITHSDIANIKLMYATELAFDGIFVDEAQDWPQVEADLLVALYGTRSIALADGLSQLIRGAPTDWTALAGASGHDVGLRSLRDGLRMKSNLAKFANALADEADFQWRITPNKQASGGRIVIARGNFAAMDDLQKDLLSAAIKAGNQPIDTLHCVPPSTIHQQGGRCYSELGSAFLSAGWECWDAVDETTRRSFPRSVRALRIVQHESCRGLEGWTTVLDGLDEFWSQKYDGALVDGRSRGVIDLNGHASAVAWRWCMIPVTRPIDTLVITLRSIDNPLARAIDNVGRAFPDIVEFRS